MKQVHITYHGHACFTLESDGFRTVLDPYAHGMVPGLPDLDLQADAVLCSHAHDDHSFVQAVWLSGTDAAPPYTVSEFVVPHDDARGTKRGMNTVRIFDFGGLRVAHLGDIGVYPQEPLLNALRCVDCLLIPIGGYYTIDASTAKQIVDAVNPRVCIPMHYRTDTTGFDTISHLDAFTGLFPAVRFRENTLDLTPDTPIQILVLQYKP